MLGEKVNFPMAGFYSVYSVYAMSDTRELTWNHQSDHSLLDIFYFCFMDCEYILYRVIGIYAENSMLIVSRHAWCLNTRQTYIFNSIMLINLNIKFK